MEGNYSAGWFNHPSLDLIKVFVSNQDWVYQCYTKNGQKAVSKEKTLDAWTWALAENAYVDFDDY
ncbi:MAG: hypothetical protein KAR13_21380 [Desulfobulbaceae bacterium]|nr:hypothetical protein [Desulfobulbaceae bacterium]MCK5323749.1 hypothetical protein [Desulfobulbaceae bacterium]MCK5436657.1 hypothetical protein [Desulfobulbaceae bacterium]MCK5543765.1 hypothetical protein [Desulfobulbaceae bacterium]